MTITYVPKNVCSQLIRITVEDGIIEDVQVLGGCSGNLRGITSLIKGMNARDAIDKMRGIRCGNRPTSCPDQLSYAIEEALIAAEEENGKQ